MKNSFVLYTSYKEQFYLLRDDQAGALIKGIFAYESGEDPAAFSSMDDMTRMAFSFIKSNLDADARKYEETCEKRRAAGKLGGRPPNTEGSVKKQEKQMVLSKSKKSIRAPDNENENEVGNGLKENVLTDMKEKSMQEQAFDEFWAIYPKKKSKGQARKAWMKLKPNNDVTAKIMAKIPELMKTSDWQRDGGRYIPYPSTWLNAEGWNDEAKSAELHSNKESRPADDFPQRKYDYAALNKEMFGSS